MDNGDSSYRRYLEGDDSAFEELVKIYYEPLTFFINRYIKNLEQARDIAIDSFAEIIAHPNRFGFKTTFKTYLFSIGRNKSVDYLRRNAKIKSLELYDDTVVFDEKSAEDIAFDNIKKGELYSAIKTLPTDMQMVVYLIYFEQLSFLETAKIMKKSAKQVYNLVYRAKNELKAECVKRGEKV